MSEYSTTKCPVCENTVPTVDDQRLNHRVEGTGVSWGCPGGEVVC